MKPPLETTKVREVLRRGGECLLCDLEQQEEQRLLRYFLGNSVMQPEIRKEVNRTGFCAPHFQALYTAGNRLGLALITHTHLQETRRRIGEQEKRMGIAGSEHGDGRRQRSGVRAKPASRKSGGCKSAGLLRLLNEGSDSCLICERLEQSVNGYAFATAYLWQKDPEFRRSLLASNGFCLPHLAVVHEQAERVLSKAELRGWYQEVSDLQQRVFESLDTELKSFLARYDYRNDGEQPESEKTVLPRAIRKLSGRRRVPGS